MRPLITAMVVIALAGCGTPAIDDGLATDDVPLPDRQPAQATKDAGAFKMGTTPPAGQTFALTVSLTGSGSGTIYSMPSGITCAGTTCKGTFPKGTTVTLTDAPAAGSLFSAWSGGCTGTAAGCAATMDKDVAVGADFLAFDGKWSGTYTNNRPNGGCNFTNKGNLDVTMKLTGTVLSHSAAVTGLELRQLDGCALVGVTNGASPDAAVTLASGGTVTGTWNVNVAGGGNLAFPFTAKITGKTMTGSWTCPSCTGTFSVTKP